MRERLTSMRRIVAVQAQVKRIAEWRLAAIEERKTRIEADRSDLARFLDAEPTAGLLAAVAMKQGKRLADREATAERQRVRQAEVTVKAQTRHKLAEDVTERVTRETRADEERRALEHLMDAFVGTVREPD